jgi:hypothetical protein
MWRIICFAFMCLSVACKEKQPTAQPVAATTEIEWKEKSVRFGNLREGETVAQYLSFKNTGEGNLVIKGVESGCGCTTVNYPQNPIAPGKEGKVEIIFNSSGRYGKQYKEIRIFANISKGEEILTFTADVD